MNEEKINPNPEKQYVVSHNTLRSILDYLSSRPYAEVFTLVQGIQSVKELEALKQEGNTNESTN